MRIRGLAARRVQYRCERVVVVLRPEEWRGNHKRVHRLYTSEGLSLRHCQPERPECQTASAAPGSLRSEPPLGNGLRQRCAVSRPPNIVDHCTHESLDIVVDQSLCGEHAADAMTRLAAKRGRPAAINVDSASEFAGKVMDRRTYDNGAELDFSRRCTSTDKALVESFNGRLRQEYPSEHWSCH